MKKILITVVILSLFAYSAFLNMEPSQLLAAASGSIGQTSSLTVSSEISLSGCAGTTMTPGITLSYDTSVGTTTCSVDTTNVAGYKVEIYASSSPALKSGINYFTDKSTTTAPAVWTPATTNNEFGYSLVGTDVNTAKWGIPTVPNVCAQAGNNDISDNNLKFMGFGTTATTTITRNSATTGPNSFNICLAAEQGVNTNAASGIYYATTTVTATAL